MKREEKKELIREKKHGEETRKGKMRVDTRRNKIRREKTRRDETRRH